MCSAVQLEEYLSLLSKRPDFTDEKKKLIEDALEYKKKRALTLSMTGKPFILEENPQIS